MRIATQKDQFHQHLLINQIINLVAVGVGWLCLGIVEHFSPGFFQYPFLSGELEWSAIGGFWPLFAYAFVFTAIIGFFKERERQRSSLTLGVLTSVLAGLWEELWFRYIFVCYAMLLIVFF